MSAAPSSVRTPLSAGQQRLWLVEELGEGTAYLVTRTFRLEGPVDPDALQRAIRQVAGRHHVLAARVVNGPDGPEMRSGPPEILHLDRLDLRDRPDAPREALAAAVAHGDQPCDLAAGPLLRALLVRVADEVHLFHYSVHHVVFDGHSRVIFEREVSAAYRAAVAGVDPELAPLAVSYGDFVVEQRAYGYGDSLEYWRSQLAGAPALLDSFTDRPRPAEPTGAAGQVPVRVGPDVCDRLRDIAGAERTSLFVVVLAACQFVLGQTAGVDDVVVGTAYAGRSDPDLDGVIGYFTNTVALRTDLTGAPTLRGLLRRVRNRVLDAMDHQEVPFDEVVHALDLHRDRAVNPLFQHWFALAEGDLAEHALALADVRATLIETPVTITRFDTELELRVVDGALTGSLTYARELFDAENASRLARRFERLLELASAAPDAALRSLDLVGADEREELLRLGVAGRREEPSGLCLAACFERQAARTPGAVAVSDERTSLTYGQLRAAAAAVAGRLRRAGVRRGDIVAVRLPRGVDLIAALLGVVSAGAAYLPIDVESPADRVDHQLDDCRVRAIVGRAGAAGRILIPVDAAADAAAAATTADPPATGPDDLLYVVYTSGSTGRPKGVAVSHGQLGSLISWHTDHHRLTADDRVAQVASISFDAAGWEIWPALLCGARLDICPDRTVQAPEALAGWVAAHDTSIMFAPTPLAEQLLRHPLGRETRLRALLTGGDVFRPRAGDDPGISVINHYGPTENAVVATATGDLWAPWPDNSIGRPIAGVRAYVLGEDLQLVPRGAVGELCLGGAAVAWGYWRRPGLTAERFRPDPYSPEPGARLYRTGDLVRWRSDDTLRYIGRSDAQVQVRGYRIEPAEVENVLLAHPAVDAAVVTGAVTRSGQQVLAAYLVPADPDRPIPAPSVLRAFLAETLPQYLVPQVFVTLAALPVTASGKPDKRRLPPLDADADPPVEPRTDTERAMHRLWCEVLGVEQVGVFDDFFSLGGNSMTAARLLTRIDQTFDVDFPLRGVFDHRSLAALSEAVAEHILAEVAGMTAAEVREQLHGGGPGGAATSHSTS